ncbi:hypothetical protein OKW50_007583 [Paraburkholderia youngii]
MPETVTAALLNEGPDRRVDRLAFSVAYLVPLASTRRCTSLDIGLITTLPAPWSAIWSAEARRIRWLATFAPDAVLVAEVVMSATSGPEAVVVNEKWPLASVFAEASPLSSTPLPLASTNTVAPA